MNDGMIAIFRPAATYIPMIPELKKALDAFVRGNMYINGEYVERFEQAVCERLGLAHAIGCSSGTHALQLALQVAGIGPGDEVITVANTYYATVRAIHRSGATPVFVEIDRSSAQIDPAAAAAAVTPKTAAILAVHLYGWQAPSERLRALADRHGILLIEDCAHAFGAGLPGARVGHLADFACYSFYPTKPMGGLGDAGMIASRDESAARRLRELRYFADRSRTRFNPRAGHCRLDSIQAAFLLVALEHLEDLMALRQDRAHRYARHLSDVPGTVLHQDAGQAHPYLFPVLARERSALVKEMRSAGVQLGIHYSTNLHCLEEFGGATAGTLPLTERHNASVVSLPAYPQVTDEQIDLICGELKRRSAYLGPVDPVR